MPTKPSRNRTSIKASLVESNSAHRTSTHHSHTVHIGSINYLDVLGSIPNIPSQLAGICDALANPSTLAKIRYANSRDAARASCPLKRYFEREMSFFDRSTVKLQDLALKAKEAESLRLMLGYGQHRDDPRARKCTSNAITRAAFGLALHDTLQGWAQKNKLPCYAVTLICEAWHTSRKRPILKPFEMQSQVSAVLKEAGYEGIFFMEIVGMRSQEKDLYPHVHGIIVPTSKRAMEPDVLLKHLNRFFPAIGTAVGAKIDSLKDEKDVVNFMLYAAKSPDKVKRVYSDPKRGMEKTFREGRAGYSHAFARDILLLRSLLGMRSLFFATGNPFQRIRNAVLRLTAKKVRQWGLSLVNNSLRTARKTWNVVLKRARTTARYARKRAAMPLPDIRLQPKHAVTL